MVVRYLATNPAFIGIGVAKASALWDALGEDLYRVLGSGEMDRLVPVLGEDLAERLVSAWSARLAEADVVAWMAEHGLDPRLALKAVRFWGEGALRRLRENPYVLVALADWQAVDRLASKLGFANDHPARLGAAVEAATYARLVRQHTWTARERLVELVTRMMPSADAQDAIALAERDGAVARVGEGYQPVGAHMMERFVADRLAAMLAEPATDDLLTGRAAVGRALQNVLAETCRELTAEQRDAVTLALSSPVSLILGAAGTGKTTTLKALGEAAVRLGLRVHQMALAGRAAARLREATGRPATTIAAFLASAQRGDSPGQGDLVVIDEASMLDLPLLYRVLRSLGEGCRLLLVGDPHQLPPIGFGLTFHVLAEHPGVPRAVLARIHRQTDDSGIPVVASAIREASLSNLPAYTPDLAGGVAFLDCGPHEILDALTSVTADLARLGGIAQILSAVRGGTGGVEAINAHFHGLRSVGRDRVRGRLLAVGDPVLFVRNDYERGLWNGSVGRLLRVQVDQAEAEFEGRVHRLGPDDLRNVALAYCLTVHKAQGSQFDRVVIPILPGVRLDRTMLYTALTRAVRQVVLVGSRRAMEAAVLSEAAPGGRETGFRAALDAALDPCKTARRAQ